MKNSSNEFYEDGSYFVRNPGLNQEDSAWKALEIAAMLSKHSIIPGNVIEVGCGAGQVLAHIAKRIPEISKLKGFDISPVAISKAKESENDKLTFALASYPDKQDVADLLLMIDVMEHVDDYYGFLRNIRLHGRKFIFHIPLDLSGRTLLKPHIMKQQRDDVGHIHYFSREMVLWALKDTGYRVIDWTYTRPVTDIKPATSLFQGLKKGLRNISFGMMKNLSASLWGGYSMLLLLERADQD